MRAQVREILPRFDNSFGAEPTFELLRQGAGASLISFSGRMQNLTCVLILLDTARVDTDSDMKSKVSQTSAQNPQECSPGLMVYMVHYNNDRI